MIVSDPMALHVREAQEQAEIEEALDPAIEAEEEEASAEYQSEFDQNISAIESNFGVSYDREKPYDGLTDPTLEAADAFDLGRAYLEKGPIGRIIMARQNVAMECQRLAAMTVAAITKSKALELQLLKLDEEEEMRQTAREVLAKTLAKNKAMSAEVRGKQAAALTSMPFAPMSSGNRSSGSGFGFGVGYGGAQESSPLSADPVASVLDRFGGGYENAFGTGMFKAPAQSLGSQSIDSPSPAASAPSAAPFAPLSGSFAQVSGSSAPVISFALGGVPYEKKVFS